MTDEDCVAFLQWALPRLRLRWEGFRKPRRQVCRRIRARAGELGIIPGSMGARSYIVRGRGAADSFHSCAHGAGRRMSRKAAQKQFKIEDLMEQTSGVICRKDKGVIDEIPGAYKDIDEVMADQADLVEVLHELRGIVNYKGL